MNTRSTARLNIPITPDQRRRAERLAKREGMTVTEFGRQALTRAIAEEERKAKLEELAANAEKYSALLKKVATEWENTTADGIEDEPVRTRRRSRR